MQRVLAALAMSAVLLFSLAGGAAASHTGLLFGASTRVAITISEWKFEPAVITLQAGTSVDLVLENKGIVAHVFRVYPAPKKMPQGAGEWGEYVLANTYLKDMGEILVHSRGSEFFATGTRIAEVGVDAGKKVTLTFTPMRKGTFEIGCHLPAPDHYKLGMKAKLVVE